MSFSLNNEGAAKFGAFTQANINRQLAIVLDGRVLLGAEHPVRASTAKGGSPAPSPSEEAADLGADLRSGALPASLTYLEERTVGPTLGADSVRAGVLASAGGLVFVLLFMLVYYKLAGFNAFVSIAANLIILLGLMAYLGATMTLPGHRRLHPDHRHGRRLERAHLRAHQGRAGRRQVREGRRWPPASTACSVTIVDTHVASLIAAAFLFQFGTGPIRGFATTLTIGLLANVFTAVFVSRTMFELFLSRRDQPATLSI